MGVYNILFLRVTTLKIFDSLLKSERELDRPCITFIPFPGEVQYIIEGKDNTTLIEFNGNTLVIQETIEEIESYIKNIYKE